MVTKLYSAQYSYEYWNSSKAILRNSKGRKTESVYTGQVGKTPIGMG